MYNMEKIVMIMASLVIHQSVIYGSICYKNEKLYIVKLSKDEQVLQLKQAENECKQGIIQSKHHSNGSYCKMIFDGVMCWPYTQTGTILKQRCPPYINGFNTQREANRKCLSNGQWYIHEKINKSWTDYTDCLSPPKSSILPEHIPNIKILYDIGYAISLVSLVLAVFTIILFKKLHCERNTIHINLFISFILRAIICFVKDVEFLPEGNATVKNNKVHFISQGSNWGCKVVYTLFHYLRTANYAWILIEGVYLHIVILQTTHHKKKLLKFIITLGWCSPMLCIIPWTAVRAVFEDSLCWSTHDPDKGYYWIIKGPIVASIVINFILFINVVRVLFTKLTAPYIKHPKRFRKLAKSTLILIPLFGVHYITFIAIPNCLEDEYQVIRLYVELTLTSFQGFIVSLLFCFLNREVRSEMKKKWNRRQLRRQNTVSVK